MIQAGLPALHPAQARLVMARNTLDLETLWVSEALLDSVALTGRPEANRPVLGQCNAPTPKY